MQNKNRYFLVALLVACQAACLGLGVAWATGWLWKAFEDSVHTTVTAQGKAIAHEMALKTDALQLKNIQPGSSDWEQAQTLCEQTSIPHDGFACLMRYDDGAMLCHTKLKRDPGLLRLYPGRSLLLNDHSSASVTSSLHEAEANNQQVIQGKVELDGDVHIVTVYRLKHLNAILAVYQSDISIDLFVISIIRPVMQIGYVLTAFIVGATAIITLFLVRRYEASLEEAAEKLEERVEQRTNILNQTRNAIVFGLAKLAESRDRDTSAHLERMRSYVTILATEMAKSNLEIDGQYVSDLAVASSLHDIGKIGVPDSVLLKKGTLSPSERNAMELHTTLGSEGLKSIQQQLDHDDFLGLAQEIALAHHENWDGTGYPNGVQGKQIPLSARIVALADVYDALTSVRPYKGLTSHVEARDWIATSYAEKFDPVVVEAFMAREQDFQRILNSLPAKPYDHAGAISQSDEKAELVPPQQLVR